jgi:uncharacterized membrane protein
MDQLLFHPRVVHLPIALAFLMPLIAGGVAGAYLRGWLDLRAWVIVVLLQGALLGSGLIALYTGGAEEERVEQIVPERHIESHEEAAELFLWASAVVLALMALPLALAEGELANAVVIFACLGSVVVLALGIRAGEAGGRLVYEHGAANAYLTPAGTLPDNRIQAIDEYEDDADSDE